METTDWKGLLGDGLLAMRISVSPWSNDEADVDRAVAAILRGATQ